jgi:hypothetical protein
MPTKRTPPSVWPEPSRSHPWGVMWRGASCALWYSVWFPRRTDALEQHRRLMRAGWSAALSKMEFGKSEAPRHSWQGIERRAAR